MAKNDPQSIKRSRRGKWYAYVYTHLQGISSNSFAFGSIYPNTHLWMSPNAKSPTGEQVCTRTDRLLLHSLLWGTHGANYRQWKQPCTAEPVLITQLLVTHKTPISDSSHICIQLKTCCRSEAIAARSMKAHARINCKKLLSFSLLSDLQGSIVLKKK